MIVENRRITFSAAALREAVKLYRDLYPQKQPMGTLGRIWLRNQSPVLLEVSIQSAGATQFREVQMGESEVGGMLILYCRQMKIPLPRHCTKAIEGHGENIVLTVAKSMPVEHRAAG
ncbi:MAG TPA: hypothetical protein VEB20_15370 [Azospirillaceae bacterium]|nr:hypothetical protein [Azospirillaceae bacterium]